MRKLIINTVDLKDLGKEFVLDAQTDDQEANVYSTVGSWLSDNMLDCVCSEDCDYDVVSAGLEVGYVAAQEGCDEVTLVSSDGGYDHWIMKGSSEKLLRDLTAFMKGEQ